VKKTGKIKTNGVMESLQCAKPLMFENNDPDFRLSIHGTCFLAKYEFRYYAITARHCLNSFPYESIRIRINPGKLEFLTLKSLTLPRDTDWDFSDLAFFEIRHDCLSPAVLGSKHFLCLDNHTEREADANEILAVVGHPSELNTIEDYGNGIVRTQGFSPDGRYAGPAEDKNCSKIRFNNLSQIKDLDGLSGSPVLAFREIRDKVYTNARFTGVLIRGSKESGMGRFINSSVVIQFLKHSSVNSERGQS
jgi:hypothetical protein